MKPRAINLEEWYKMSIDERFEFQKNGGELTNFSRIVLNTCHNLIDCGAIIPNDAILKYYRIARYNLKNDLDYKNST